MPQEKQPRASKAEKLLKKVVGRHFTFEESQADLELLRSLEHGSAPNTKPGDLSFHAYVAALNTANEFAGQALDIPESPDYLKYGKRLGYWLEFLFQAFAGYTGNMSWSRVPPTIRLPCPIRVRSTSFSNDLQLCRNVVLLWLRVLQRGQGHYRSA